MFLTNENHSIFSKFKKNYGKGYILLNSTCSCGVRAHNFIEFEQELTENVGVLQREVDVFATFWMFLIR